MKLILAGTPEEQRWFRERLGCPNGVPCPRHKEHGVAPIADDYPCNLCFANNGTLNNVTYVDALPDTTGNITLQLKSYVEQFKTCDECSFMINGKCFFDYNCPADLPKGEE